jgi:hypothetical protein
MGTVRLFQEFSLFSPFAPVKRECMTKIKQENTEEKEQCFR